MSTDVAIRLLGAALIGGASVMAAFAFNRWRQRKGGKITNGWRYLIHGPIYWVAMLGSLCMTAFFWWMYLCVPSARMDQASYKAGLAVLIVGFSLGALIFAYILAVDQLRWNDVRVECRTLLFRHRRITWYQLAACGYDALLGLWWITAYEGPKIRFSPYCHGAAELLAKIRKHLPADLPPGAVEMSETAAPRLVTAAGRRSPR